MPLDRDFADAFDAAQARLRAVVDSACVEENRWASKVATVISRVLEFAAAEPAQARVLTSGAFDNGVYGALRHRRMVEGLAAELGAGRRHRQLAVDLPELTEEALIGGVAEIVAERLRAGEGATLPDLASELIELVLTPYLGAEEAKRVASEASLP
ncbi:MAG TPA: hypothetical protein VGO66_00450 [Solirubrobacterales bacterium]|nr:hypothetical protein [Solirubrobacterales bacterium]